MAIEGSIDVTVVVDNVDEPGEVVFTEGAVAYFDQKLVAQVKDPDDHGGDLGEPYQGVRVVTWQWSWSLTGREAPMTSRGTPKRQLMSTRPMLQPTVGAFSV